MKTVYVDRKVMRILQDETLDSNGKIDYGKLTQARNNWKGNIAACENNAKLNFGYSHRMESKQEAMESQVIVSKLNELLSIQGDWEVKLR